MSRAEHLQWCKDRALEYVERGDGPQAIASMLSDLGKRPETALLAEIGGFLMLTVNINSLQDVRRFIEGFN